MMDEIEHHEATKNQKYLLLKHIWNYLRMHTNEFINFW